MSQQVTNYVCSIFNDDSLITQESLLTTMFLIEKWKKNIICGPDESLAKLLEVEEIDIELMQFIRQMLIRFINRTDSLELLSVSIKILSLFQDKRDIPLIQTLLIKHSESLLRQNRVLSSLFFALGDYGEKITDRSGYGSTDIDDNLKDIRNYIHRTFGIHLPW